MVIVLRRYQNIRLETSLKTLHGSFLRLTHEEIGQIFTSGPLSALIVFGEVKFATEQPMKRDWSASSSRNKLFTY